MQLSHAVFMLQPASLAAPSHDSRPSHGGRLVLQQLGIAHDFGASSGSTAAGLMKELSATAIGRRGDFIAELVVKQQSLTSSKRPNFCVSCAAIGTNLLSGVAFSWPDGVDYQSPLNAVPTISALTSRQRIKTVTSSSAKNRSSSPMLSRPARWQLALPSATALCPQLRWPISYAVTIVERHPD